MKNETELLKQIKTLQEDLILNLEIIKSKCKQLKEKSTLLYNNVEDALQNKLELNNKIEVK